MTVFVSVRTLWPLFKRLSIRFGLFHLEDHIMFVLFSFAIADYSCILQMRGLSGIQGSHIWKVAEPGFVLMQFCILKKKNSSQDIMRDLIGI